jgi:pimeloyl-ACP methyl ester carboxylesterase
MVDLQFHSLADGRRIAFRHAPGQGPAIVFLPGYMSDMAGSKAQALLAWAEGQGRECLLLDYSGCGDSPGDFAEGTLSRWQDEVVDLVQAVTRSPLVLVGSSMGGWLMLLAGLALGERLAGLVGIAAAPDFTDWGFDETEKAELAAGRTVLRANSYGPEPTPTHAGFWADGQTWRLLGGPAIALTCPVRLLHGQDDDVVPSALALQLAAALGSPDVQVTLVKGGDHRLSRDGDIDLLLRTVAATAEGIRS